MEEKNIKEIIGEFFKNMGFEAEVNVKRTENLEGNSFLAKIKTDEPKILIGQNGQTLTEIQHLLNFILRRKLKEQIYVDVDINDYKEKKNEYLKETAEHLADEVVLTKKEKILPPMSAYERRIIHLELAKRTDIETESVGQDPDRRIVIKPKI